MKDDFNDSAGDPAEICYRRGRALLGEIISSKGDPAKALQMIEGADLTQCDRQGLSALCWAARQGYGDVVKALVKAGASVNNTSHQNWTPLHWAAVSGNIEALDAILSKKVDVNAKNDNHDTPLTLATLIDGETGVTFAERLLKHGADVRITGANGMTPLESAQSLHQEKQIALFTPLVENLKPATSPAAINSATTLKKPLRPMKPTKFYRQS